MANITTKDIVTEIERAISGFNKMMPNVQNKLVAEIELLLKDIEANKSGSVKVSVANIRLIAKIKNKIQTLFRDAEYLKSVTIFISSFDKLTKLQNKYFKQLEKKFEPKKLYDEIRKQAKIDTIETLTGAGMTAKVSKVVNDVLKVNITTGANYSSLLKQVRKALTDTKTGEGLFVKYAKQITTDALNQYNAQYVNAVSNDLGLKWFVYDGALIETSRTFCEACVAKEYIHVSEFPKVVNGDFEEFKKLDGAINSKTNLPAGMIDGTNAETFHVYRGGYNCGHQLLPISEIAVPIKIREKVYRENKIRHINGIANY